MSKISAQNTDFYGNAQVATPSGLSNPYSKVLPDGTVDMTVGDELGAGAMGEEAAITAGGAEAGAAGAASLNPYIMAGALALQAYSADQKQKQEYAMAKQAGMEKAAQNGVAAFDRIRNLV